MIKRLEIKEFADIIVPTRDKPKSFSGKIPWVTLPDLQDDLLISDSKLRLTHEEAAEVGNRLMPAKTVLLSCAGSLGKVAVTTKEIYANQQFYGLVVKENFADPFYLAYSLKYLDEGFFKNLAGVSTIGFFSKEKALGIQIPLPPLEEQKRIAEIARKCDRIRRTRRYTQQLSDTYLQSVFLDMFGDPVANSMNWEMSNLGSKITFITSGSRGWAEYYSEKGDIFLRIQNVGRGNLLLDDLAFVQAPETAEGRRTKVKPGDVLISITADLGRTAVIPKNFPQAFINQHLCLVRTKNINPIFLAHYLNSEGGRRQFEALDRAGVKSGLNFDDIRSLNLILPPISLQEQYAEVVLRYQRISNQRIEATRQAEHLFQTVLHHAFLGEL